MFEAQEDQSETSQQTSASDDEKGPESQVLYQPRARVNVSWPSGNSLGNFHQLQLIGDSTYDYSEWDIRCVSFPLFKWIWDNGIFWRADLVCTVVSSWWQIVRWLTRNKWFWILRGTETDHTHISRHKTQRNISFAHTETAGGLQSHYSGNWNERYNMRNTN